MRKHQREREYVDTNEWVVGSRALQLAMGAPFLIKLTEKDLEGINYNPLEIAKRELEAGVIPISVKRDLSR